MNKICYNCIYWVFTSGEQGECHRYPPKGTERFLPCWPSVHATDWCGEHKMKEKNKESKHVKTK